MKKLIVTLFVSAAMMASVSVMAQAPAKDSKAKTEACCKKDAADKKACCKGTKAADKKACCKNAKASDKKTCCSAEKK